MSAEQSSEKGKEEQKKKTLANKVPTTLYNQKTINPYEDKTSGYSIPTSPFKSSDNIPYYAKDPKLATLLYYDVKPALKMFSSVDVCFICDITGDMDVYIDRFKKAMSTLIQGITEKIKSQPRVAFIGFRDIDDGENQIVKHDFTLDIEELKKFINNIKCSGGYDICEDLVRPLTEALDLDWRSDLLYVYLLIEAPTHGRSYHTSEYTDCYKGEDKKKMIEKLACHYRKNKINLIILRCNSSVDITIEKIREYYESPKNKLAVIDLSDVVDTSSHLENKMIQAFEGYEYENFRRIMEYDQQMENIDIDFGIGFGSEIELRFHKGVLKNLLYEKQKYTYKFSTSVIGSSKCVISGLLIEAGIFSGWRFMKLKNMTALAGVSYDEFIVQTNDKPVTDIKELQSILEANSLADYFALCFNNIMNDRWITLLPMFIVEFVDKANPTYNNSKFFIAQKYMRGTYAKFNNNYGWVLEKDNALNYIAQAFSHFTYEYSLGTLMVVDIQGTINETGKITIKNPSLHSAMYKDCFGETNHSKLGIFKFFQTHRCNTYCKIFMLTNPNNMREKALMNVKAERMEKMAKCGEDPTLKQLYSGFEENIKAWQEKFRNFNPKEPPVKSVSASTSTGKSSAEDKTASTSTETCSSLVDFACS
eukprot:TRINITY_DN14862_c0_g1_i4.p1 TRINITY_DN14862_c0_g1~~TRINITY_DN14862_c0_g1_i4.p1  ORF type:complete len:648 (-),score=147.31 TRINITY_DN14862_c0_g1_i4:81-2024(-)